MILGKLVDNFNDLTEVERKIAESILENPELFIDHSVADIADKLYVSKTSIINFAQKMGFQGYSELRYFIRSAVENEDDTKRLSTFEEVNHHLSREVQKTFEERKSTRLNSS